MSDLIDLPEPTLHEKRTANEYYQDPQGWAHWHDMRKHRLTSFIEDLTEIVKHSRTHPDDPFSVEFREALAGLMSDIALRENRNE